VFLFIFAAAEVASASNCLVQLRTWQKNANPDSVFYSVGVDRLDLPEGQRFDIYVQWESKSATPYLMTAGVSHAKGSSVSEKSSDYQNGSIRIDTVSLGISRIDYKLVGRSDGKALNIPSGCETGSFFVNVVPAKKYFDVTLAQTANRDLSIAADYARQLAYQQGSFLFSGLNELAIRVRNLNTSILSCGGDVILIENDLNSIGSMVSTLRLQSPGNASPNLQMQIQRVETLYMRLLQIVAPE
jgi:hypothetical protein